jgi:predicted DNA-binding protein
VTNATIKIPVGARDRIKAIAEQSGKSMASVVDEAISCYEALRREQSYLEGWERFKREDPQGFADYMSESSSLELGLCDSFQVFGQVEHWPEQQSSMEHQ